MRLPSKALALVALALIAAAPGRLSAQVVRGHIVDAGTGAPIAGTQLRLVPADNPLATTRTDSLGEFVLSAQGAGTFFVRAEKLGYRPAVSNLLNLSAADTLDVQIRLSPQIVLLDTIQVVAPRRRRQATMLKDFYDRLDQRSFGVFVTRADIDRARPNVTTELLRSVAGFQLTSRTLGDGNTIRLRGNCSPTIYIDGVRAPLMGMSLDDLVDPMDIEGMEIYKSVAEAPVQYQGLLGGCSAILVWTRIGT
jgi:hypothetical protein